MVLIFLACLINSYLVFDADFGATAFLAPSSSEGQKYTVSVNYLPGADPDASLVANIEDLERAQIDHEKSSFSSVRIAVDAS